MAYKDDAKLWFQTGDYPTQEQCYTVFDWLRWKDENIPVEDIIQLQEILDDKKDRITLLPQAVAIDRTWLFPIIQPLTNGMFTNTIGDLLNVCGACSDEVMGDFNDDFDIDTEFN